MKHYVDSCTACIMKDAKIELLKQELNEYRQGLVKLKEEIKEVTNEIRPAKKGRYPPSGYD